MKLKTKAIHKFLFLIVLSFVAINGLAQIPDEISTGLRTGNARMLSKYFNQNIELVVLDSENIYSKAQAQTIVANFFSKYPPNPEKQFSVIHETPKEDSKQVIGSIESRDGEIFRIYFLLKKSEGNNYIHVLRIEKNSMPQ